MVWSLYKVRLGNVTRSEKEQRWKGSRLFGAGFTTIPGDGRFWKRDRIGDRTDLKKDLGAVWRKLVFDKLNELGERIVSERRLLEKKGLLLRMKGSREEIGPKKGKERIRIGRVSCSVGLIV